MRAHAAQDPAVSRPRIIAHGTRSPTATNPEKFKIRAYERFLVWTDEGTYRPIRRIPMARQRSVSEICEVSRLLLFLGELGSAFYAPRAHVRFDPCHPYIMMREYIIIIIIIIYTPIEVQQQTQNKKKRREE